MQSREPRVDHHRFITSNRPVEDWGKLLGDNAAVSAMLDRLLRRVKLTEPYPIAVTNVEELRKEIGRQLAAMGRKPGAKGGGNADKRVRITIRRPSMSASSLGRLLAGDAAARGGSVHSHR